MSLPSITSLRLERQQLQQLPRAILQQPQIEVLSLAHNHFQQLGEEIGQMQQLRVLDLSYNKLQTLPAGLEQLQHLEVLYLQHNQFKTFPKVITQLPSLRRLYLDYNGITKVPSAITNCQHLEVLYLNANQLSDFPDKLEHLQQLREIQLLFNGLKEFPEGLCGLSQLTTLRLKSNGITTLPPAIALLQHLKVLDLGFNPLQELPPEFAQLQALKTVDFTANAFTSFPLVLLEMPDLLLLDSLDLNFRLGMSAKVLHILAQNLKKLSPSKTTTAHKVALFKVLFDKKVEPLAQRDFYPLLALPNQFLQKKLRAQLLTPHPNFDSNSQLLVVGKAKLLSPNTLATLPLTTNVEQATHFILGKKITQKEIKSLPASATFVDELSVHQHYNPLKSPEWLAAHQPQMIDLLHSYQEDNILLVLEWIKNSTYVQELATDLLLAYLHLPNPAKTARRALRQVFQLSLPHFQPSQLPHTNFKLLPAHTKEQELARRIATCAGLSQHWQGLKIAQYLLEKEGRGYVYLIKNIPLVKLQDWLQQFVEGQTLCLSALKELQELPPLQGAWTEIERLDLQGCNFQQAPTIQQLKALPNLVEIDLRHNPIRFLPRQQLQQLAAYRILLSK